MAASPVAGDGDVAATAGTGVPRTADSGKWKAGPVQLKTYAKLKAGGKPVAHQAECTFSFVGTKGNSTVTDSSTVTLTESGRPLQKGQQSVLVSGDSASDSFGNKLAVTSTRHLHCTA